MVFTALAVGAGLVLGLLSGGRLRLLGQRRFLLWPLLPVGVALQLPVADRLGFTGLLLSYVCLLVFAAANLRLVGMGLVAGGIGLNMLPILLNRGMPVDREAVVAARIVTAAELPTVRIDHKHHLQRHSDRLLVLSDTLPIRPLREVVSFGDVVLSIGVADVVFHLLQPLPRHVRHDTPDDADPEGSLPA